MLRVLTNARKYTNGPDQITKGNIEIENYLVESAESYYGRVKYIAR